MNAALEMGDWVSTQAVILLDLPCLDRLQPVLHTQNSSIYYLSGSMTESIRSALASKKRGIITAVIFGILIIIGVSYVVSSDILSTNNRSAGNSTTTSSVQINTEEIVDQSSQAERIDTSDWLIYTNEEHGFSLSYPNNWQAKELDAMTIGFVSPERVLELEAQPSSIQNSDFYIIFHDSLYSLPYVGNDLTESLQAAQRDGLIRDLELLDSNRAIFLENNSFTNEEQLIQYYVLSGDLILSIAYSKSSEERKIVENIMNSLSTQQQ